MWVILITRLLQLVRRYRSVNRFNHTSLVDIVTQADRPKSVRNHCVIGHFGGVLCVVILLFSFSVGVEDSVVVLGSKRSPITKILVAIPGREQRPLAPQAKLNYSNTALYLMLLLGFTSKRSDRGALLLSL